MGYKSIIYNWSRRSVLYITWFDAIWFGLPYTVESKSSGPGDLQGLLLSYIPYSYTLTEIVDLRIDVAR